MNLKNKFMNFFHPHNGFLGLSPYGVLLKRINKEIDRYKRDQTPFCLACVQIENIKQIYDMYSLGVGEEVQKEVVEIIGKFVGPNSLTCIRLDGEFILFFPRCSLVEGIELVEKIKKTVDEHKFDYDIHLTVSIGVDEYHGGTREDFFAEVDKYAYMAKHDGRNRVCHREN